MRASAVVTLLGLLGVGCMTYDFEPVSPLGIGQTVKEVNIVATPPKPALMLVVDKSGSMAIEVSPGVSRLAAMKSAMGTFLMQAGDAAHLGMLPFPGNETPTNSCAPGDIANVASVGIPMDEGNDDGVRLAAAAVRVKDAIDALPALGGTPTALTMRGLTTYKPLLAKDRTNFAVLLTDGLPNCNEANAPIATTCTCIANPVPPAGTACQSPENGRTQNLCLDDQGSAAEIALLQNKGVRTIVIGFGTDVANPAGAAALATMASAGAFSRPCTTAADCSAGDTCNPGGVDPCGRPASTCGQNYFTAGNATELGRVLQAIKDSVTCPVCLHSIAPPSDPTLLSVIVNGTPTMPGPDTWRYLDNPTAPAVEFVGALCDEVKASTVDKPVHVEFRSVEAL